MASPFLNLTGTTQSRQRSVLGGSDDAGAGCLSFHSGKTAGEQNWPELLIAVFEP